MFYRIVVLEVKVSKKAVKLGSFFFNVQFMYFKGMITASELAFHETTS